MNMVPAEGKRADLTLVGGRADAFDGLVEGCQRFRLARDDASGPCVHQREGHSGARGELELAVCALDHLLVPGSEQQSSRSSDISSRSSTKFVRTRLTDPPSQSVGCDFVWAKQIRTLFRASGRRPMTASIGEEVVLAPESRLKLRTW